MAELEHSTTAYLLQYTAYSPSSSADTIIIIYAYWKHNLKNSHAIPIFLIANGFTMSKFNIDDMNMPYHYLSLLTLIWPLLLTEVYIYSNHSLVLVYWYKD